ncbi:MAG: ribonuclease HI [Candidatus Kapabacteria bacterium]|nr:ribonuclease HI [Candidatus Kapabacteria bacterium]
MTFIAYDNIIIYTDGSCLGNPGPGAYAAVLISGDRRKEISKGFRLTTNNRMEIRAVIEALKLISRNKRYNITVYTDSRLVCDAVNKNWLKSWAAKGWKKSDKKPVLNQDLWQQLVDELQHHNVVIKWVEAHVGIVENERCDSLGKEAAASFDLDEDYGYSRSNETK